jgi:antitoxin component YwqK of YwqJK toxin-antitoxin module
MKNLFLFFVFCIFWSVTDAQFKVFETSEVSISSDTGNTEFSIITDDFNNRIKHDNRYYWYTPRKVISTKGGYDGKILHGVYKEFYEHRQLRQKGEFKFGLKSGKWNTWDDQGEITSIKRFKKGYLHGKILVGDIETWYYKGKETTSVLKKIFLRLKI